MRLACWFAVLGCGSGNSNPAPAADTGVPEDTATETPPTAASLAPGEAAEVPVKDGVATVRLATPSGAERFILVVASTKLDKAAATTYSLGFDPIQGATPLSPLTGCSLSNDPWKTTPLPAEKEPSGTAPTVGTTKTLDFSGGCTSETITIKAIAVGKRAIVWADVTPAHPATLDSTFVDEFLKDFDDTTLPRERTVFGMESDQDGDGRVSLVFTPLTKDVAVAFFTGCDLLDMPGCGGGNKGEYLYLTPPADIAPPYNTPAAVKETLAHELGHLVHFNRKVLRNKATSWNDSAYVIEGFGGFAQDVVGFQAGNLYVAMAGLQQINDFSMTDVLGLKAYDTKRDGALRGGGYWFIRYVYDRGGGDEAKPDGTITSLGGPAFLRALMDATPSVAASVPTIGKTNMADVVMDFYTALAMSNRDKGGGVAPKNPCFAFLPVKNDPVTAKPRGGDLFASFHGMSMSGPKLQTQAKADGSLRGGGVEYVQLDPPAGAELDVTVTVDASALPRVRVVRWK